MKMINIRALALALAAGILLTSVQSLAAVKISVNEYSQYAQKYTAVDMRPVVNRGFSDETAGDGKGGWSDQGSINDMDCFTLRGICSFKGVDFDIIEPDSNNGNSALLLRGQRDESLPTEAVIPVNDKCAGIYFLHTSPWCNNAGEDVGEYILTYEDGQTYSVPLAGGEQIFNWWGSSESEFAVTGWTGENKSSNVSLGIFAVDNPHPDKVIKEIKAVSRGIGPYIALVGITLTDAGPYLPREFVEGADPDTTEWFHYVPCEDPEQISGTAIDASFLLDAPAGKHGFVCKDGENFVFEDGTPAQFWGVNIASDYMYLSEADARDFALRISQAGFNLVRFHFMSTDFGTNNTELFGSHTVNSTARRTNMISKKQMNRLCYFMSELKKRGVYFCMDFMTGGPLYKDDNYQDIKALEHGTRGPNFFDPDLRKKWTVYARQILEYENPYTGIKIGNEPAFAMASLYNESSLFMAKDFSKWEYYYPILKDLYNQWLRDKYKTRQALEEAWYMPESELLGLKPGEDPIAGTVEVFEQPKRKDLNSRRYEDNMRFIGAVEMDNFNERITDIRNQGAKLLITGSTTFQSAGNDDIAHMYSNVMASDFYTVQPYLYLPYGISESARPGTYIQGIPVSEMSDSKLDLIGRAANVKVFGKPFMITEWDGDKPNPYSSELIMLMGAFSAMQNWHPVMFNWLAKYSVRKQKEYDEKYIYALHSLADRPSTLAALPNAAMMVLRNDVAEAQEGFFARRLQNDEAYTLTAQERMVDASVAMCGKTGTFIDDNLYDPEYNSNRILKLAKRGNETGIYSSVTGELQTDTNEVNFKVNTERSQAVTGFIGGKRIELDDVIFEIENEFASVYLSSLTGAPLSETDRMLCTLTNKERNKGQEMDEKGTKYISGGEGPILIEQIKGRVTLKSGDTFRVWALDSGGQRMTELMVGKSPEGYSYFEATRNDRALNYEIIRTSKSEKALTNQKSSFYSDEMIKDLFDDLGEWNGQKDKIERIVLQGYMKQTAPGKFSPESVVTRGAFAAMLADVFKFTGGKEQPFADVLPNSLYYKPLTALKHNGVISGGENSCFMPDEPIKIEDMLLMTKRALDKSLKKRQSSSGRAPKTYKDYSSVSGYAKTAVGEMISLGYFSPEECIAPDKYANRAEASILLYEILWG